MSQTVAPIQVTALPIGSGGKSESAAQLNNMNTTLTMLSAQSQANTDSAHPILWTRLHFFPWRE